jgi:transposase
VGIEVCASSHHWSRDLQALGHTVRLMPPAYVKSYVKRQKNDTTDTEAIRGGRETKHTVRADQNGRATELFDARHLFIRQQTAVINSIRAYLAEFGIVAPIGRRGVEQLLEVVADTADRRLPEVARACLAALGSQLRALKAQILGYWSSAYGKAQHRCSVAIPSSRSAIDSDAMGRNAVHSPDRVL